MGKQDGDSSKHDNGAATDPRCAFRASIRGLILDLQGPGLEQDMGQEASEEAVAESAPRRGRREGSPACPRTHLLEHFLYCPLRDWKGAGFSRRQRERDACVRSLFTRRTAQRPEARASPGPSQPARH